MMKSMTLVGFAIFVLFAAAWLAPLPGQAQPQPRISWTGNLATLEWIEPLADPKAAKDEVPFTILTGPYLGRLTATEAIIGWEVLAEKNVTATPYASLSAKYPDDKIQIRSVRLTDLEPNTLYKYQLKSGNYVGKVISFRTMPAVETPSFRFAMIGDTQRGDVPESAEIERKLFADILAWNPALVIHLGDMMEAGRGDGLSGRKSWYRALTRNREMRGSLFMAPTAGNHCWQGSGHGWYADYFAEVKGPRDQIAEASRPPFYYSFDVGQVHFVCLCTETAKIAGKKDIADEKFNGLPFTYNEQLAWFERDLSQTRQPWKVVYFHKPFHTAGGYPVADDFRNNFGAVCDKFGVQVLLSGHDHSYQKTRRITNGSRQPSDTGTVQVVSGGGDIKQFDARMNPPSWNLLHRKINHYVQVEVARDAMQFTAVDVKGQTFDAWRLPLQGQPVTLFKPAANP